LVDWSGKEAYVSDIRRYFLCCPLCGNDRLRIELISLTYGGHDTLACEICGAKWHLYLGITGLSWAELELAAKDGRGVELLGKRLKKTEWKGMAQNVRRTNPPQPTMDMGVVVKEKEIIRQKEVIVKIRCSYCHNVFDETLDKCPHCGAKQS
jgi:hypothetical protein